MRTARAILITTALTFTVLVTTVGAASAAPAPAVSASTTSAPSAAVSAQDPAPPAPDPDAPDAPTAPDGSPIGSVSQVARAQLPAPTARTPVTLGRFATPAQKSQAIWAARGMPDRLIIVRRGSIDTVAGGRLQRHAVRFVGTLSLTTLRSYVPSSWLSIDGPTARLSATLVLSTGVTLTVAAPVTALALTGGAAPPAAASIITGGGSLALRGTTVTSADPATGAPMPIGPGRPYIAVSQGGRLDATDATISDLGSTVGPKTHPGVAFGAGSTGSVVRTTLARNSVGLGLDESRGVQLANVTISKSVADGLMLRGDTGTGLALVNLTGNGGNGAVVSGASVPRPITGLTTNGNRAFGLLVVGQTGAQITGVATTGDGVGGLEINRSSGVTVGGFTATDEPTGVYTHVSSSDVTLDGLTVSGGRQGVVVEKTTTGLKLVNSTIKGTQLGVSLGARGMALSDVTVADSRTAVAVQRGAAGVTVDRLTITGGKDGFIANPGTTGVIVRDLVASGVANTAVRALSPGEQIIGGRIDGGTTAIDIQAPTVLSGASIVDADTGVRARAGDSIRAGELDIDAASVGINVSDGTPFVLTGSRVHALESIRGDAMLRGTNDLSLPPLSLLGAIGVPLIALAVLLELVAAVRGWRRRRRRGPAGPVVTGEKPRSPIRPDRVPAS